MEREKIGIMGGTFNPIHFGHLLLAEAAYEQCRLDKILIMPTKNPYYKKISKQITDQTRIDMVKLAIADNPHFEFSDLELQKKERSYTAKTLSQLQRENPNTDYFFLMGADSLFHMDTWKTPQKIFNTSTIVVACRNDMSSSALQSQVEYLDNKYDNVKIVILNSPNLEISSNDIRRRRREGRSIRYFLPREVEQYIEENNLYVEEEKA